jgi:hypothetical protein
VWCTCVKGWHSLPSQSSMGTAGAPRRGGSPICRHAHTAALSIPAALLSAGANARRTSKNSFSAAPPLPLHHEKRTSSITQQQQCKLPPGQYCGRFFDSSAINLPHISSGTARNFHKFNALPFFPCVKMNACGRWRVACAQEAQKST